MLRRMQLFEFEDQSWLPVSLRNVITDILGFFLKTSKTYQNMAPILAKIIARTGETRILDLCSGSGGPASHVMQLTEKQLNLRCDLRLSDKYPNHSGISYFDALGEGRSSRKLRTMFTALHHFTPDQVNGILDRCHQDRASIAFFEFTERTFRGIFFMLIGIPIIFLCSPFIRPFRWSRIFWVYIVPLAPLILLWDGIVSALRSYKSFELLAFASRHKDYYWEAGKKDDVTYLIGVPIKSCQPTQTSQ